MSKINPIVIIDSDSESASDMPSRSLRIRSWLRNQTQSLVWNHEHRRHFSNQSPQPQPLIIFLFGDLVFDYLVKHQLSFFVLHYSILVKKQNRNLCLRLPQQTNQQQRHGRMNQMKKWEKMWEDLNHLLTIRLDHLSLTMKQLLKSKRIESTVCDLFGHGVEWTLSKA